MDEEEEEGEDEDDDRKELDTEEGDVYQVPWEASLELT